MTDTASMRARVPAQSVIEELLRRHQTAPPRSLLNRLFGRVPLTDDALSCYVSAQGEIQVAAILAELPPEWATFHAIPIGGQESDIDHLVVGPGGIFTINTRHHAGENIRVGKHSMHVNGEAVPHLINAEAEAARVTTLLRERMPLLPPVQPVIALIDPSEIRVDEKPEQVKVVDARQLPRWLSGLATMLAERELDEVVDILDEPETWGPLVEEAAGVDGDDLQRQFAALTVELRQARTLRVLWAIIGCAALAVAAVGLAPRIFELLLPVVG